MPWKRKTKNKNQQKCIRYYKRRKSLSKRESLSTAKETTNSAYKASHVLDISIAKETTNNDDKASNVSDIMEDKSLENIPDLCNSVDRSDLLNKSLEVLTRTRTLHNNHKACVCTICDSFIIGVEKICWLNEEEIATKQ